MIHRVPTKSVVIVETGVSSGATKGATCQSLILIFVDDLHRQTEVDSMKYISLLASPHRKVFWLYIAMDIAFLVDVLESRNGLVGDEEGGLERKPSATIVE